MMKYPVRVLASLGHQEMEMSVKINPISCSLNDGHNPRSKLCAGCGLEVFEKCLDGCLAKIAQKPALVLEEDAEHPGDDKDDLAVGDRKKKLPPHPLAPFLTALRMARWAKSAATTRKVKEPLLTTVRTPDAGKPAVRVAAVEVALDHILDEGPEKAVLFLEAGLILGQELVKVMEEHPVEHGAFGMSGTVNSCHSRRS